MFKNRLALQLTQYFLAAIVTFSLVMAIGFSLMFERYIAGFQKKQFVEHAGAIASNLSNYMDIRNNESKAKDDTNYDAVLLYAIDISVNNLWIIDKHHHILASYNGERHIFKQEELTTEQKQFLSKILDGETLYGKYFTNLMTDSTMTVGAPVKNKDGTTIGAVLLHTDFNARKTAFKQMQIPFLASISVALCVTFILSIFLSKKFTEPIITKEAKEALRLEETRREFVAIISHELKTPISILKLSLEALDDKIPTTAEQIDGYHEQMMVETLLLERLVSDLLDLAKLQNREFVIEKENISLNDILSDVARNSRQIARDSNIEIDMHLENKDCVIYGDYERIRQMLMIVMDNAIKYSPQNSKVIVTLRGKSLSICDKGFGISSKELPYIFDKFYRGSNGNEKNGAGLGLVIAKQIADRHNIGIKVDSKKHHGTKFIFQF